jgi:hypothetical protein
MSVALLVDLFPATANTLDWREKYVAIDSLRSPSRLRKQGVTAVLDETEKGFFANTKNYGWKYYSMIYYGRKNTAYKTSELSHLFKFGCKSIFWVLDT